jgi:hypothetical protein
LDEVVFCPDPAGTPKWVFDRRICNYGCAVAAGVGSDAVAIGAASAPRGPRRRAVVAVLVAVVVVVVVVVTRPAPRTAEVCGAGGTSCVSLLRSAGDTHTWALLPIGAGKRLEVRNAALTGPVGIGVVGYLGDDTARLLPVTTTTGSVTVPTGRNKAVSLSGVPDGARLVLVRTDGVVVRGASACSGTSCSALRVGVHRLIAAPSAGVLTRLLAARSGVSTADARTRGASVAAELSRRASEPARLTAGIRPGSGRLTVDWLLSTGGQDVSSVRLTVRPKGTVRPVQTYDAIAASGSFVLHGLDRTTRYLVDIAPVVRTDGKKLVSAPVELSAVPDGAAAAAAAAGETTPSAPKGWTSLIDQDFTEDAPLGTFADRYPGWSWYDGMTETSRETNRPRSEVGVWNSATTMSVHDGLLDCDLHTAGEQPQVCALTPTPTHGIWHGQKYGRYSVRFKADPVPGYKIAWLLWPDSDDWTQGEIDFPEASLDGTITGSSHRNDGDPADFAWFLQTATKLDGWHTATIDWEPGRLTYMLDGESWTTTDPAALPRVAMRWTLQAETEIVDTAPARSASGHILIDWVAAWSRSG